MIARMTWEFEFHNDVSDMVRQGVRNGGYSGKPCVGRRHQEEEDRTLVKHKKEMN